MPKYRKKPVEIEAEKWDGSVAEATAIVDWLLSSGSTARYHDEPDAKYPTPYLAIDTLEGTMAAAPGDWIIRGVQGEFYPCKPDIFAATYEAASSMTAPRPEEAWIIRAEWSNSSPTYHGPFQFVEQAEDWARRNLSNDPACNSFELAILSPAVAE